MNFERTTLDQSCPCCGHDTELAFRHQVLRRYEAEYRRCNCCGYVTARPAYWLDEAYGSALGVNDTGVACRNEAVAGLLMTFAWLTGLSKRRGLDAGGAHGLLVRMLRDRGLEFRWSDKYAENLFAKGFEDDGGPYHWISLVEVFEHLSDPFEYFSKLIQQYSPRCIFFTTELMPTDCIPEPNWWYWNFDAGQHIGFATRRSLQLLAKRLGYIFASVGSFHILTKNPRDAVALRLTASAPGRILIAQIAKRQLKSLTMTDFYDQAQTMKRSQK